MVCKPVNATLTSMKRETHAYVSFGPLVIRFAVNARWQSEQDELTICTYENRKGVPNATSLLATSRTEKEGILLQSLKRFGLSVAV